VLCERGVKGFDAAPRTLYAVAAVPALKHLTHLPIVVDPSHATGHWDLVEPMARAAVAAGADGLMIEVHPDPVNAFSDGPQSLKPTKFTKLVENIRPFVKLMGRTL